MPNLRDRIENDDLVFDSGIVSHGYAPHLRDYDIVLDVPAALPPGVPTRDTTGSYIKGRYRYRFTHCPEVHLTSAVSDETWRASWDDLFIDYGEWERAGNPGGFVWGVCWAEAYPGLSYLPNSADAASWSERLGQDMHEVLLETNVFELRLICHDLRVKALALGDPVTRELIPVDPERSDPE